MAGLLRRPKSTAAILLGMAALASTLLSVSLLYLSVGEGLRLGRLRLGADAMAVPRGFQEQFSGVLLTSGPTEFYIDSADALGRIKEVEGVSDATGQLFVVSAPLSCCTVADTMIVGFDPETDFTLRPWLMDGDMRRAISDGEVIAGSNIKAGRGGRLRFYGSEFVVVGKLEPTGLGYMDNSVFVPIEGVKAMVAASGDRAQRRLDVPADSLSAVLIRFREGADAVAVALRIEYRVPGVSVVLPDRVLQGARRRMLVPVKVLAVAGLFQWALSLVLIGVIYSLSVTSRQREIGVLMAMGARRADVLRLYRIEVAVLSVGGAAVGSALGLALLYSFRPLVSIALDVPFLLPSPLAVAAAVAAAVALCSVTGFLATTRIVLGLSIKQPFFAMQDGP